MWGLRSLLPTSIRDVIAAMALFRPATMNTGATRAFIARKHKEQQPPERHALIARVTADTHGIMLYQEQVIDLLRGLGMGADDLTEFLKAVKASNKDIGAAGDVIESYQRWINERCQAAEMSDDDQYFLHNAIAGFAEYGFNRAHATVYGITAYRAAYLAARHPLEFHAALLGVASSGESGKENRYLRATRRRGIRVLPRHQPLRGHLHHQPTPRGRGHSSWTSVNRRCRCRHGHGLEELQPFHDLDDLVQRAATRAVSGHKEYDGTPESLTGILGKLRDSGALSSLDYRRIHEQQM
jgi:hypothetical protein